MLRSSGGTPLFAACHEGHADVVQQLIEAGAELNRCSNAAPGPVAPSTPASEVHRFRRPPHCAARARRHAVTLHEAKVYYEIGRAHV